MVVEVETSPHVPVGVFGEEAPVTVKEHAGGLGGGLVDEPSEFAFEEADAALAIVVAELIAAGLVDALLVEV